MHRRHWILAGLLLLFVCSGCAKKPVKVSGRVTLEGAPLRRAVITFHPIAGEGRPATAVSDENGSFQLTTVQEHDGAYPGTYRVTVLLDNTPAVIDLDRVIREGSDGGADKKASVHTNYTNVERTPIEQVVPAAGPIELVLTRSGT